MLHFYYRNMILWVKIDTSYFYDLKASSRACIFLLIWNPWILTILAPNNQSPLLNSDVYVMSTIMRNFPASAIEVEMGILYKNCCSTEPIHLPQNHIHHHKPRMNDPKL